ncbi:MAG TPA: cytidine deaminase [Candidatus Eisenbacteria bacterium]
MSAPEAAQLLEAARALLPRAHAPHSRFRVAAVLEDDEGRLHPGVNVESASLGLTLCAERNAVFGAIARGATRFQRIAVVSDARRPCVPCGACRQVLAERAPDLVVVLEAPDGSAEETPLAALLPRPFTDF